MSKELERRLSKTKWHQAAVIPEGMTVTMTNNSGTTGGNTWIGGGSSGSPWQPNTVTPFVPTTTAPPGTTAVTHIATNLEFEEADECADGHIVDHKSIRTIIEDGEDQITSRCLFCEVVIYIPDIEGALSFERAGKAVGRAMTLGDGDGEAVGDLLADVLKIERDLKAEMKKFERALKMLDIARDLVEQRACA